MKGYYSVKTFVQNKAQTNQVCLQRGINCRGWSTGRCLGHRTSIVLCTGGVRGWFASTVASCLGFQSAQMELLASMYSNTMVQTHTRNYHLTFCSLREMASAICSSSCSCNSRSRSDVAVGWDVGGVGVVRPVPSRASVIGSMVS